MQMNLLCAIELSFANIMCVIPEVHKYIEMYLKLIANI